MLTDQTDQANTYLKNTADSTMAAETDWTWETWFQLKRSAYVGIDATLPITEFEREVRDALSLSYLTLDELIEPWSEPAT